MKHCVGHLMLGLALSATPSLFAGEEADPFAPVSLTLMPASGPAFGPVSSPVAFSKDSWSLQISGNYLADLTNRHVQLAGGTLGVGYYFDDGISLNLEGAGYHQSEAAPTPRRRAGTVIPPATGLKGMSGSCCRCEGGKVELLSLVYSGI